MLPAWKEKKSI